MKPPQWHAPSNGPLTTTVESLIPGDLVTSFGVGGTFIARLPHPVRPGFQQVVWRLLDGSWSYDCLSPIQHIDGLHPATHQARVERLRAALEGSGRPSTPDATGEEGPQ